MNGAPDSGNVFSLHGERLEAAKPNEALIRLLEEALARARAGNLRSFIGTGFTAGGLRYSLWCDDEDVTRHLGALAYLQQEFLMRNPIVTEDEDA